MLELLKAEGAVTDHSGLRKAVIHAAFDASGHEDCSTPCPLCYERRGAINAGWPLIEAVLAEQEQEIARQNEHIIQLALRSDRAEQDVGMALKREAVARRLIELYEGELAKYRLEPKP